MAERSAENGKMSVIVSIGRHEKYGQGCLSLTPEGAATAVLSAKLLADSPGKPDKILSSPLPRARLTAELRGLVWQIPEVEICPELDEDAALKDTDALKIELCSEGLAAGWKHIHLVTHQPTISRLNGLSFTPLNPGDIMVWQADDWLMMERGEKKTYFIRPSEIIRSSAEERHRFIALFETAQSCVNDEDLRQKIKALL